MPVLLLLSVWLAGPALPAEVDAYRERLAAYLGDDAAFLSLLERTRLAGGWPRYLERFPGRYSRAVRGELAGLEEALLHNQVCGTREDGIEGYRRFVSTHPNAPSSAALRDRIAELEAGGSPVRFTEPDGAAD